MAGNRAFFAVIPCQTWPCYAKKTLKVSILQLNPHQFVDFYNQNLTSNYIFSYFSIAATPIRLKKIM